MESSKVETKVVLRGGCWVSLWAVLKAATTAVLRAEMSALTSETPMAGPMAVQKVVQMAGYWASWWDLMWAVSLACCWAELWVLQTELPWVVRKAVTKVVC